MRDLQKRNMCDNNRNSTDKYIFTLDDITRQYALDILNESDESRERCLEEIKKWLEENKNLHARSEDKYILPFLRGCKFKLDRTKEKLTNYYTMRRDRPEWFKDRNPLLPNLQELIKLGIFVPLKNRHQNRLVVIIRPAAHDPNIYKQDDIFKAGKMILDLACLGNEYAQIYGAAAVFDMTGMSFAHYKQLTPNMIKNAVFAWQNYHVRPKQLEFINAPIHINVALSVFKSFMKEKLRERVQVHYSGAEALHGIFDKKILPTEYGGEGESLSDLSNYWWEKMLEYREWFADDEIYKAE